MRPCSQPPQHSGPAGPGEAPAQERHPMAPWEEEAPWWGCDLGGSPHHDPPAATAPEITQTVHRLHGQAQWLAPGPRGPWGGGASSGTNSRPRGDNGQERSVRGRARHGLPRRKFLHGPRPAAAPQGRLPAERSRGSLALTRGGSGAGRVPPPAWRDSRPSRPGSFAKGGCSRRAQGGGIGRPDQKPPIEGGGFSPDLGATLEKSSF